jgi:AcrR family transcriptional regulator
MAPVPRVTEEHLNARRQQILDAARVCFLRNGFHQTSMQDVIKEANLSVGAVYRYFPSKNDLITALAEQVIDQITAMFDQIVTADPPPSLATAMQRATDFVTVHSGEGGTLRMALQVWSEAMYDPTLAAFVARVYGRIRIILIRLAERAVESGALPAGTDPTSIGVVLFSLMPGYALQRILTGGPDPEVFKAGLRTLLPAGTMT